MLKLMLCLTFVLISSSCAKNKSFYDPHNENTSGSREFKIQNTQTAFKISLFGVYMGTPDYEAVWTVIEEAQSHGMIDQIVQFALPIEGGIAHCIEVVDVSARQQLLESLQNTPTSLKESNYSIESVDSCNDSL